MTKQTQNQQAEPRDLDLTCQQVTALLVEYVAGELDARTVLALEEHLRNCRDCVAFLNTYRETIQTTRSLRYDDMPADMQNRMLHFLQEKIKGLPPRH